MTVCLDRSRADIDGRVALLKYRDFSIVSIQTVEVTTTQNMMRNKGSHKQALLDQRILLLLKR